MQIQTRFIANILANITPNTMWEYTFNQIMLSFDKYYN
jgi:hypothetical protein